MAQVRPSFGLTWDSTSAPPSVFQLPITTYQLPIPSVPEVRPSLRTNLGFHQLPSLRLSITNYKSPITNSLAFHVLTFPFREFPRLEKPLPPPNFLDPISSQHQQWMRSLCNLCVTRKQAESSVNVLVTIGVNPGHSHDGNFARNRLIPAYLLTTCFVCNKTCDISRLN